jgi:L-Ala-D/L-Glu epimerase
MNLTHQPYDLYFKYPFTISGFSRTHTRIVLTQIALEGYIGYGEATLPPYLGETAETISALLDKAKDILKKQTYPFDIEAIMSEIDALADGNKAAKAGVDIALHDLKAKMLGIPVWQLLGANPKQMPVTSCTLGIDTPSVLRQKIKEAKAFKVLKVKLGSDDDKQIINTIREVTDKPLYVDANQGWKDRHMAVDMVLWLADKGVQIVEQPMLKTDIEGNAYVSQHSPIPIFADESFQRLGDMSQINGAFHGINVKLMKCTGLNEGLKIVSAARKSDLKIMIGCMSETSCAIKAAAALAPLCDYADLDGPWLVKNNPFDPPILRGGKIQLSHGAGLDL